MFNIFDFFSDTINRILVSQKMGLNYVFLGFSNYILSILKILKLEGYIDKIFLFLNNFNIIIVKLKYYNNEPVIKVFKKISKTNLKIYKGYRFLPKLMNGLGTILVSTTLGILTDRMCKMLGVGGEVICYVF